MSALAGGALLLCGALAALPGPGAFTAKRPLAPNEKIDLNRASTAELMRLPGVGPRKARAIVELRSRQPFKRPEDVTAVKGLGPAWFARVKNHLVVGAPALAPAHSAPLVSQAAPGPHG